MKFLRIHRKSPPRRPTPLPPLSPKVKCWGTSEAAKNLHAALKSLYPDHYE